MVVWIRIPPEEVLNCSASIEGQLGKLATDQQLLDSTAAESSEAWTGVAGDAFAENIAVLDVCYAGILQRLDDLNAQLIATKDLLQQADSESIWPQPQFTERVDGSEAQ